jgi:hypothetical protein
VNVIARSRQTREADDQPRGGEQSVPRGNHPPYFKGSIKTALTRHEWIRPYLFVTPATQFAGFFLRGGRFNPYRA